MIDWENFKTDPIFRLTFPQKEMLEEEDYEKMKAALNSNLDRMELKEVADSIRMKLNPHPAGQMEMNVPEVDGEKLPGIQHKYDQTVLFFPSSGQLATVIVLSCFRWQFIGLDGLKLPKRKDYEVLEEHHNLDLFLQVEIYDYEF